LLLDASEQRKHILEGLEKASKERTLWGQDCRALCPEVTVSNFLSQGGKGFVDFLTHFLEIFEASIPNKPTFFPNPWWEQASNDSSDQTSKSTEGVTVFEVATIDRNKFIGIFFSLIGHGYACLKSMNRLLCPVLNCVNFA